MSTDIEDCLDSELNEFPLRMRDWLKNVLVTLYERDEDNNLLTEKQKLRVRKDFFKSNNVGVIVFILKHPVTRKKIRLFILAVVSDRPSQ